jgi:hypothetical protein
MRGRLCDRLGHGSPRSDGKGDGGGGGAGRSRLTALVKSVMETSSGDSDALARKIRARFDKCAHHCPFPLLCGACGPRWCVGEAAETTPSLSLAFVACKLHSVPTRTALPHLQRVRHCRAGVKQPSVEVRFDDLCARKTVVASSVDGLFTVGKDFKSKATVRTCGQLC